MTATPIPFTVCPNLIFSFETQNGNAIDTNVFSYTSLPTKEFSIHSTDVGRSGIYPLRLIANYDGYTNAATLDFQVTVVGISGYTPIFKDSFEENYVFRLGN